MAKEKKTKIDLIAEKTTLRSALELLVEECAEVTQASSKIIRSTYRDATPTNMLQQTAIVSFIEELDDVRTCADVVLRRLEMDGLINPKETAKFAKEIRKEKLDRWINRLETKNDEQL